MGITTKNGECNIDVLIELYSFVCLESIMRLEVLNSEILFANTRRKYPKNNDDVIGDRI